MVIGKPRVSNTMSPGGPVSLCVRQGKGGAVRSAGGCYTNSAEHAPDRHFVTRIYPFETNSKKKGRKETPASSYCASAPGPGSAAPSLAGSGASRRACAQLLGKTVAGPGAAVSRMRAPASAGKPAPVTCRLLFAFEAFARGWLWRGAGGHGHSVSVSEALAVAVGCCRAEERQAACGAGNMGAVGLA